MEERDKLLNRNWGKNRHTEGRLRAIEAMLSGYSGNPKNIGNLKHGDIDNIISSPPYSEIRMDGGGKDRAGMRPYTDEPTNTWQTQRDQKNIGNLKHGNIDKIISSPPFADSLKGSGYKAAQRRIAEGKYKGQRPDAFTSPTNLAAQGFADGYSKDPKNIGNLKLGSINKIITSPPFGQAQSGGGIAKKGYTGAKSPDHDIGKRSYMPENTGVNKNNISNLPYADKIITSPPYEETMSKKHHSPRADKLAQEKSNPVTYTDRVDKVITSPPYQETISKSTSRMCREEMDRKLWHSDYGNDKKNIGNLKQQTYLQAMAIVYDQCFRVLKPEGLMILITKDFIRKGKRVPLGEDTIKLCELAGFTYIKTYHRKIENPSFWRILYEQKYPDAEKIDCEDILIFRKEL